MADQAQPGLLFSPGPTGSWDSERISSPRVLRLRDGSWRMFYYGRDPSFDRAINLPTGRCGMATSTDGLNWTRAKGPLTMGAIFEPHPSPERFDSGHVGVSDVHFDDGLYWMWYFGGDQSEITMGPERRKGIPIRSGCAISGDGLQWQRVEGPYRGAVLDVGPPGSFDAILCGWPTVLREEAGGWKMYYHTVSMPGGFAVALATSRDRLVWEKAGIVVSAGGAGRFDEAGAATRHVIKRRGEYFMFYEGVNTGGYRSIGLAMSKDGIAWKHVDGPEENGSVLSHAPKGSGRWDAYALGCPCVVPMPDGSLRMYYIGSNETASGHTDELSLKHQIGLAVSPDGNPTRWRRWTA